MKTRKNIFKSLWASLKPALLRFPALFVLGFVVAVCAALSTSAGDLFSTKDITYSSPQWHEIYARREAFEARMTSFILPGCWGMMLSVLLQLLCERLPDAWRSRCPRFAKLLPAAVQIALAVLALFPGSLFFTDTNSRTWLVFTGILCALVAVTGFVLMRRYQPGIVVPNAIIANIVAGIACGCVVAGLELIYMAFDQLIFKVPEPADTIIPALLGFIPFFVLYWGLFTAYVTRAEEEMVMPKPYRIIALMILLPLYVVLIAVLYIYLIKSLVTLSIPSGKINPFVSCATAFYVFFWFATAPYQTRFTELFRKIGPFVLMPLVATQCIAFAVRISAYGYTQSRVASLLYILFSIGCIVFALVRQGRYMHWVPALLAVFVLAGSISPLNIMDSALHSQSGRIFRVYRGHGLLSSGCGKTTLDAENAAAQLTAEEKALVVDAWHTISPKDTPRPWMEAAKTVTDDFDYKMKGGKLTKEARITYSFEKLFGFPYSSHYGEEHGYRLAYRTDSSGEALDVSAFQSVWELHSWNYNENEKDGVPYDSDDTDEMRICVGYGRYIERGMYEHSYELTEEILSRMERYDWDESQGKIRDVKDNNERLFLTMPDGTTLVLTQVSASQDYEADGSPSKYGRNMTVSGYACR